MKEIKVFIIFLLVILSLILVLTVFLAGSVTPVSNERSVMIDVWQDVCWFSIPSESVEHGDDGIIQWNDPGMEAHIRFLLRKPEGDILKSDVWDIQVLTIQPGYHTAHDSIMTTPPEGQTAFDYQTVIGATRYWEYYESAIFPPIENLQDLSHFDNLQILCINLKPEEECPIDLSGLEFLPNLKVFQLTNAMPRTLTPLSSLHYLQYLTLDCCGTLDLTPLTGLPALTVLSLSGSDLISLEPLPSLSALSYLDISMGAGFPSLEPLARTSLAYLTISQSPGVQPAAVDYAPLSRIPGLVALSLSEHPGIDGALCQQILAGCRQLQYLDIYGTPAAYSAAQFNADHLMAFVTE